MRKLVLILVASIAVITFIRAYENSHEIYSGELNTGETAVLVVE